MNNTNLNTYSAAKVRYLLFGNKKTTLSKRTPIWSIKDTIVEGKRNIKH